MGSLHAQDKTPKKVFVNGYLKDMISVNDLRDSALVDNLIHNRLNFSWYPSENLRAVSYTHLTLPTN